MYYRHILSHTLLEPSSSPRFAGHSAPKRRSGSPLRSKSTRSLLQRRLRGRRRLSGQQLLREQQQNKRAIKAVEVVAVGGVK